jgi:hypothetical protein
MKIIFIVFILLTSTLSQADLFDFREIHNYIDENEKSVIDYNFLKREQYESEQENNARIKWNSQSQEAKDSDLWTHWYKENMFKGLIGLADMREKLEKGNIFDSYVLLPKNVTCNKSSHFFRTANGMCNDLDSPIMGSTGVRFGRNINPNELQFTNDEELIYPNPRTISKVLLTRKKIKEVPFLNLFAASWIQFMVHDWVSHGENDLSKPFYLKLDKNDVLGKEMLIFRTKEDPTLKDEEKRFLPEKVYNNEVTHWWDGSQIYGSNQKTEDRLREFKNGLLKIDGEFLPLDTDSKELTGFNRNWWVGLASLHTIFVKEHNQIAKMLKNKHPDWNDQHLFSVARLINSALLAKIHTVEWTPAILPNKVLRAAMNANWYGIANKSGKAEKWYEFYDNHILNGIVGNHKDLNGVNFTMTEEFTSVYRLHSLLPEELNMRSVNHNEVLSLIPLENTRDEKVHKIFKNFGNSNILYSLGTSHPGQLVLGNFPKFMQEISVPFMGKIDLAALDIFRDRERGVPRYNDFRKSIGLKPINKFEDLTSDQETVNKLKQVYHNDVSKIDLLIGTLAESNRPTGYGFGETQFQIFILMASRRIKADRFYTTDYNAQTYTQEGLDWIDQNTMKSVILRHHPELKKSLYGVLNAFNPWNVSR